MIKSPRFAKALLFLAAFLFIQQSLFAAIGRKAMVATAHPIATEAAVQVLQEGGNAVDAAIAAQWMLNVVEPQASGIGGGGFFLFYEAATKRIYAFDGREQAPQEAFPEMFLDKNKVPYPFIERATGGLPVGVPGTLRLLKQVHNRFGSKRFSFSELFDPAIQIAEEGFLVSPRLAGFIDQQKDRLARFEASRNIFFNEKGEPRKTRELLVQPDLAQTFRQIQQDGVDVFYEGKLAQEIVEAVRRAPFHPGLMKKEDLFYYQAIERLPLQGTYRGYDIFSMGPPSSGGSTLIEALNILENFDLKSMHRSADFIHVFSEAQKLAFQNRNRYLGDPKFTKIPLENLLSKDLAKTSFQKIQMNATLPTLQGLQGLEGTTTSHISIADEQGNIVSYTTTIEHIFGSAMVVPGRGFLLNNELTDFDEIPNDKESKLKANAPQPEKRPRSSMTPTLVFKTGRPVLIVGSPGGSTIIATVLNVVTNVIDFKMPLEEALSAARILNRDGPLELEAEIFANAALKDKLREKGNEIIYKENFGNAQAIFFDEQQNEILIGASDPRSEGRAAGY